MLIDLIQLGKRHNFENCLQIPGKSLESRWKKMTEISVLYRHVCMVDTIDVRSSKRGISDQRRYGMERISKEKINSYLPYK